MEWTYVVLNLIHEHLLKVKEDEIDIFTHLVVNAGRQGKVRLENTTALVNIWFRFRLLFPKGPVRHTGNIHHVDFGGYGRRRSTSDGTPVVYVLVEAFHMRFEIITHCIPAITHAFTLEGTDSIGIKIMKLTPMIKILFSVWIHDEPGLEI
jgi:hypothetical protein